MKKRLGVKEDTAVPASGWKDLVAEYKQIFKQKTGSAFPDDPMEQLWGAIGAVFGSWMAEKAVTYRRVEKSRACSALPLTWCKWCLATREKIPAPVSVSRGIQFRRKGVLRRLPNQRARRRCCGRNSHADAASRDGESAAESLWAVGKGSSET